MRRLFVLLQNLVVGLFVLTQNLLKALWVKPPPPDWVTFDLTGDPPYRRVLFARRLAERLSGRPEPLDLHTLAQRFDRIAESPYARGVVLRVDDLSAGLSKIEALRELVAGLRARGKSVVFWAAQATARDAALLLSGDRLYLAPAGRMALAGVALETTTGRAGLARLGAEAHVFRRGTHKSAGELFTRDGISPEQQETVDHLLDDLHERIVDAVATGRGLDRADAARRVDEGPYTARQAEAAGLVDGLCYGDQLPEVLASEDRDRARLVPWPAFRATTIEPIPWKPVLGRSRVIAVVPLRGMIVDGESRILPGGGRAAGSRSVGEALAAARRADSVRAVVLHVDSRGGSALASDLIWREVRRTAKKKPVVAYLDSVAASGGYYCAAGAAEIVASPVVLTGSIGVLAVFFDLSGLYGKLGVTREVHARGRRAAMGTSARAPTDEERAAMEGEVEEVYRCFLERVAEGRGLELEQVRERAEGRVYTGRRALELGLVDSLGGFEDAVTRARELAGLAPGADFELTPFEIGPRGLLPRLPLPGAWLPDSIRFDVEWSTASLRHPAAVWAVGPYSLDG